MFGRQDIPFPYTIFPPWPDSVLTDKHYEYKVAVGYSPTDCYKLDSWSSEMGASCCRYYCTSGLFIAGKYASPNFVTDPVLDGGQEKRREKLQVLPIN